MKIIITIILMLFLSSCSPVVPPQIMCDISFQFNRCRCRCFSFSDLKAVSPLLCEVPEQEAMAWNLPIEACDGMIGFGYEEWAVEILPYLKELKHYYNRNKKKIKKLPKFRP